MTRAATPQVEGTAVTNSSGEATIYLTKDGTPTGDALYASKPVVQLTCEQTGNANVTTADFTLSDDFKTLTIYSWVSASPLVFDDLSGGLSGLVNYLLNFEGNLIIPVPAIVHVTVSGES